MKTVSSNIKILEALLTEAEAKENRVNSLLAAVYTTAGLSLICLTVSAAELILGMSKTGRLFLFLLMLFSAMGILIRLAAVPLLLKRIKHLPADHVRTAEKAGRFFTPIKDDLRNVLQIAYDDSPGVSEELKEAAAQRAVEKYGKIDFTEIVKIKPHKNKLLAASALIITTAMLFIFVSPLNSSLERVINYNKEFTMPAKYLFDVKPGNIKLPKGGNVDISVLVKPEGADKIQIFIQHDDETGYSGKEIAKNPNGEFILQVKEVKNSFTYFASFGGVNSPVYKAEAVNYPILQEFGIKIIPPSYTGLKEELVKDNGSITALAGTRLVYNIKASKVLKKAEIIIDDSLRAGMKTDGTAAAGEIILNRDAVYYFGLTDTDGYSNVNPVKYTLKVIEDAFPLVKILTPGESINPSGIQKLNIIAGTADDYGISRLELKYSVSGRDISGAKPIIIPVKKDFKEGEVYCDWNIKDLYLRGGETVEYYLEVFDNDNVNGPKSAKSAVHKLVLPTLDEIMKGYDKSGESVEKDLGEILKEAEKLKKEIEKSSAEMKKEKKELSWEEKNSIAKNAENFKQLLDKTESAEKKLSELSRDMKEDKLLSKETLDKYEELQNLFKELNNDELKQALQKLQDAMQNMMRDAARQPLDKMNLDEENFKNSLERTINLLKQIKVEQKIDEALSRIEKLEKDAGEIKSKIDGGGLNSSENAEALNKREKEISAGIKGLDENLKSAAKYMKETSEMPVDEMNKFVEAFKQQQNERLSENSSNAIMQRNKDGAIDNLNKMSQNFSSLHGKMSGIKAAMLRNNQMKTVSGMMKALNNLISLSKEQEAMRKEIETLVYSPAKLKEKAKPQNELKENLLKIIKQITELSQKSFGITPELGNALGKALNGMQQSISSLEGSGGSLLSNQRDAMEGLNRGAELVKGSVDKMMGGGAGGGMTSFMQQLQQIIKRQSELNSMTGQLKGQDAAGLQRLARQQDLIRKSLEKLNREAAQNGKTKTVAGNIEKTIEEVRTLVKDMSENKPINNIAAKQEKILSRMLDSQQSMTEKDYEKKRESVSGKEFDLNSPGRLNFKTGQGDKRGDELLNAEKEGYSKDYKSLIRRYFEILEKKKK